MGSTRVASPFLFGTFLADMQNYLDDSCGIRIDKKDDIFVAHVLFAESAEELQTLIMFIASVANGNLSLLVLNLKL